MPDRDVLTTVGELVEEEHRLRLQVEADGLSGPEEQARLQRIEVQLDQCWDLLRRRGAARASGQDPGSVQVRPPAEVEGYLQ